MHEAGVARRAIEAALEQLPEADRSRRPIGLDVRIDPARISGDSLTLHLELALGELGLAGLSIDVTPESVACPACGTPSTAEAWLLCESCGAPLPAVGGPMAVARFRY